MPAKSKEKVDGAQRVTSEQVSEKQAERPEKDTIQLSRAAFTSQPLRNSESHNAALQSNMDSSLGASSRARDMTALQQSVGNTRVSRLLGTPVQAKLTVSSPADDAEQEAEKVADSVMRMPEPMMVRRFSISSIIRSHRVQRLCQECEKESNSPQFDAQRSCPECGKQLMRQPQDATSQPSASAELEGELAQQRGGGQSLPESARVFFEPRFGQDFSGVRVHTDQQAGKLARDLSATAFTAGQDIYFGEGDFQPDSPQGQRLIAHELTHVVQRQGGASEAGQRFAIGSSSLHIQREEFGENVRFNSLPGPPPRAVLYGPFTDQGIAEELYGDRTIPVQHDPANYTVIFVQYAELQNQWKPYFRSAIGQGEEIFTDRSAEQVAEAGIFALGTLLHESSNSVELLRNVYNQGIEAIVAERANLIRQAIPGDAAERIIRDLGSNLDRSEMVKRLTDALPEAQATRIAQRVADMRHQLALEVRRTGGVVLSKGAELVDAVRGHGRPTYNSLRVAGKTDAEIIRSATRTNRFINRLPRGMRVSGGVLWLVSAGISFSVILSADPTERARVAREEIGALVGSAAGTAAAGGICAAAGIATAGIGLAVCGILGGLIGGAIGRDPWAFLQALDMAPHVSPGRVGAMYRIQGAFDETDLFIISIVHREVEESEHVVVVATGTVTGELMGGRGHYRRVEVIPANAPAVRLLGDTEPRWVADYLLYPVTSQDLEVA